MKENVNVSERTNNEFELTSVGHFDALLMDIQAINALPKGTKDENLMASAFKHAGAVIASNIFEKIKVRDHMEKINKDTKTKSLLPEAIKFLTLANNFSADLAKENKGFIVRHRVKGRTRKTARVLGLK